MPILRFDNTIAYRGATRVFDDLHLTVEPGQNTAIIGPNGAGKTTLLRLITREIYPAAGSVELFGKSNWNVWNLRKRLGIVSNDLQNRYHHDVDGLSVVLSGFHSSVGLYDHHKISDAQIALAGEAMENLGVAHLRDREFSELSTGEQRKFLLARALVNQPEALIFDEPTAGLDLRATFAYLNAMRELMKDGTTIVVVTHHIHEIPPEIDNVVLLKQGQVIQQGAKAEVLTAENLSELFETPVSVVSNDSYYHVFPG